MPSPDIKIFTQQESPRLCYIASLIIWDIMGLEYEIVTDRRKLGKYPVINYSAENIPGSLRIDPDTIIFETGIRQREIVTDMWHNLPVFFLTRSDSDIPFDIFAASFFMVSRYEEYLDFQPDKHGRFAASLSLAYRNGFNEIPVVDLWVKEFTKKLLGKYPQLTFKRNEYKALLTIDIDVPFAYPGRNILRQAGGMVREITRKKENINERYHVLASGLQDPYETSDYITEKSDMSETELMFFFSVGEYSKFDKNPSWRNSRYRELIKKISADYSAGLHPSYYAGESYSLLEREHKHLKRIISKEVRGSRFHYLRLFFPASYRKLLKEGIREDYSMGWHDEPGFRAGIARPYYHYDLIEDRKTELKIVPFQFMDAALFEYKNLDPAAAKDIIFRLIDNTRKAGGIFVSLWHNTTLLETPEWKEWRMLFESMLQYQKV